MSEYPKIQTLYERDKVTSKVIPGKFKNPVYTLVDPFAWEWTEKIDGTNIRLMWDFMSQKYTIGGRTDKAQLPQDLVKWINDHVPNEAFGLVFPDCNTIVYGEGYGGSIQKSGHIYGKEKKFIVFDVLVDSKWWLNYTNTKDVATRLGLETVPYFGEMPIDMATKVVQMGVTSKLVPFPAEGLVGRPKETMFDKNGDRLIVKLKTSDFAQEEQNAA